MADKGLELHPQFRQGTTRYNHDALVDACLDQRTSGHQGRSRCGTEVFYIHSRCANTTAHLTDRLRHTAAATLITVTACLFATTDDEVDILWSDFCTFQQHL